MELIRFPVDAVDTHRPKPKVIFFYLIGVKFIYFQLDES